MANGLFGGGTGTTEDPYLVEDAADLDAIRNDVYAHYSQVNDLDLIDYPNWKPIGNFSFTIYDDWYEGVFYEFLKVDELAFRGKYSGNKKVIENLTIRTGTDPYHYSSHNRGMFGYARESELVDVFLKKVNITSDKDEDGHYTGEYVGALVGYLSSSRMENCHAEGLVEGGYQSGLLVGNAGWNDDWEEHNNLIKCSAKGIVRGFSYTGGMMGWLNGRAEQCYFEGTVNGIEYTGGLIGSATVDYDTEIIVEDCYAKADVTGVTWATGALIGELEGTIDKCYTTGTVNGPFEVGGLVGTSWGGTINNSYNNLLTMFFSSTPEADGFSAYFHDDFGDIIADNRSEISNCFTVDTMHTIENLVVQSATVTELDARTRAHYVANSWDFNTIWDIKEGQSYPFFKKPIPVVKCKAIPMGRF